MYKVLESGQKDTMEAVLKRCQDECSKIYTDYYDRFASFVTGIKGRVLKIEEIFEPCQKLHDALSIVRNPNDMVLLAQATCRMFQENCWGAVVTVDYSDMYHNRDLIYKGTLLTVCDPLYLLVHLDTRVRSNFYPKDEAKAVGLPHTELVAFPARSPHIA
jgi:hypothetical protein